MKKRDTPAETGTVHLYTLADDVGQRTDLAPTMPEKVAELRKRLAAAREPLPVVTAGTPSI
ncbi:MAG: hypothetical protein AAF907_12935 [Planctomycetota bacterium]